MALATPDRRLRRNVIFKYDDKYVYGVGTVEVEFEIDQYTTKAEIEESGIGNNMILAKCIEIMVSDVPRDEYNQPSSFFDRCYAESRYHDYHKDNRVEDTE